jgi:hypothetical protein
MPQKIDPDNLFAGRWELIPELCQYQEGHVPPSCTYSISLQDGHADFDLSWTDKDGKDHHVRFGGPVDGSIVPHKAGHISELSVSRVDERTLDSSAYADGHEVSYSRRSASADGALLSVQLVTGHADADSTRNFQVYRRASA